MPFAKLFAGLGVGSTVGVGGAVLAGTTTVGLTSTAAIAGSVAAGVVGSVASQAFGVAARLQDGISWKGVALAGISAGVSGGLAGSFERIAGSAFLGDVVRGALGSVVSQGIGVATRLQDKFDFAGVAAAGLGSGASGAIGLGGFEGRLVGNTVGGLANAATRSLLGGTDFGDNILAALPDIIGQTVGGMVADGITDRRNGARKVDDPLEGTGVSEITIGGPVVALSFQAKIPIVSGGKIPESVAEARALQAKALRLVASAKASRAEKDKAAAKVRTAFAPYLNEARYAAPTAAGSALALAQSLADGLSGALLQVIDRFDANYQARRDYVDKLGPVFSNNPIVLLADATETLTTTVASGIANTPSALAHPMRTFVREPAAFIDGALREEAKGRGYQRAYAALQSSTPRQVAAGVGRTAGVAVLIAGPSKFAAGRTSFVPREYAPIAAERLPTQLELNSAAGKAFQARVSSFGNDTLQNFVEEVSIRPNTATGQAPFKIRADGLGTNPDTLLIDLLEAKGSATAPLTKNQTLGFPLLEQYGGTIVGTKGGVDYPSGTIIGPGTKVQIIRPSNIPRVY